MSARDLISHSDEVRSDLLRGLRRLSDDDLDFKPAPGYDRTAADIAIHIADRRTTGLITLSALSTTPGPSTRYTLTRHGRA